MTSQSCLGSNLRQWTHATASASTPLLADLTRRKISASWIQGQDYAAAGWTLTAGPGSSYDR